VRNFLYSVIVLLCLVTGLALHLRNQTPVTLDLYLAAWTLPLSLLLVLVLTLGALLGALAMLPGRWRLGRRLHGVERELRQQARGTPATTRAPEPPDGA